MTVEELRERMTHVEFVDWLALFSLEREEQKTAQMRARAEAGLQRTKGRRRR